MRQGGRNPRTSSSDILISHRTFCFQNNFERDILKFTVLFTLNIMVVIALLIRILHR